MRVCFMLARVSTPSSLVREREREKERESEKEGENEASGNTKVGSITVPLTSCLTGLESAVQNRLIQTSQTGGQQYSENSPFSIP